MEPWEKARAVLVEAKAEGMEWERAWLNAMRAFCPPRTAPAEVHEYFEVERALQHELKPWWQSAYENRDMTVEEFEKASSQVEKRLDELFSAAA